MNRTERETSEKSKKIERRRREQFARRCQHRDESARRIDVQLKISGALLKELDPVRHRSVDDEQ